MKILFVMTQSLDSPSGIGRYGPWARELAKRGYDISVAALHPSWHDLAQHQFEDQGVNVHYVSQMHVLKKGDHKIYLSPTQLLWVSFLAICRLWWAVWRSDAEILILCKPQPFNSLAIYGARRGRVIIGDCDDYEAETNKLSGAWQKSVLRFFEDNVIRFANYLTVNTHFLRDRFGSLGFAAEKIFYLPNGVEQSRFEINSPSESMRQSLDIAPQMQVVGYFGTLGIHSHPVDLLLEAFVQVLKAKPYTTLLLVGGGEDIDQLREMARTLGIAEQTIFVGRVTPDRVPAYIACMDVSVDPVHDDGIAAARSPLKVMESFIMGVPVVTSPVGDRPLLLANDTVGQLVQASDVEALAEGLLTVLDNPPDPEKIRAWATQWSWSTLTDIFVNILKKDNSSL